MYNILKHIFFLIIFSLPTLTLYSNTRVNHSFSNINKINLINNPQIHNKKFSKLKLTNDDKLFELLFNTRKTFTEIISIFKPNPSSNITKKIEKITITTLKKKSKTLKKNNYAFKIGTKIKFTKKFYNEIQRKFIILNYYNIRTGESYKKEVYNINVNFKVLHLNKSTLSKKLQLFYNNSLGFISSKTFLNSNSLLNNSNYYFNYLYYKLSSNFEISGKIIKPNFSNQNFIPKLYFVFINKLNYFHQSFNIEISIVNYKNYSLKVKSNNELYMYRLFHNLNIKNKIFKLSYIDFLHTMNYTDTSIFIVYNDFLHYNNDTLEIDSIMMISKNKSSRFT